MKPRDLIFAAWMVLFILFALSSAVSAGESVSAADDSSAVSGKVVFNEFEVNDPTCVCSADPEYFSIFIGPEEESCIAS